jgi:hypothetical protein
MTHHFKLPQVTCAECGDVMRDYDRHIVTICEPPALVTWFRCQGNHRVEVTWSLDPCDDGWLIKERHRESDPAKFYCGHA